LTTINTSLPPFWPSRRLWVKFFLGLIYAPLLFFLLLWLIIPALFLRGLHLVLLCLLFVGGPISIGFLLSPGWRGVRAGLVAVIAIPAIWYLEAIAIEDFGFINIDIDLQLGLFMATVVVLLEIITGDVRGLTEIVGLGIGFAVGLFLIFVNTSLLGSFTYTGDYGLLLFYLYLLNALVWLNTLFFPEYVSGKVGWGGVVVWIVLVLPVLGLSFAILK
jgi:hypothetical protein